MTAVTPHPGSDAELIVNPASGERIRIRPAVEGQVEDVLVWDLWLAPGGHVPSGHVHPRQSEVFHVRRGRLRFRVGLFRSAVVGPGQSLRVPPGLPHHFSTVGDTEVHAVVETSPRLEMEALLRVAARLAADERGRARRLPRPLDLLLFMDDFRAEVRAPYLPAAPVRRTVAVLARLVRGFGLDRHYRRTRSSSGAPSARAKASR
ncbi:cupin domain-containing protein [Actinomadura sp. 7K507]|uniref:cupin domain-containing protein n=1 Tax=Actinomadura sp. 7K507 TaxID=2530365 RepID=UPI00104526A9|nr:cupin domain-containing protein [Actinomadura sp. 7K507]TDC79589.1 cupin domain-containing protein [Actinomadura sp. 7K507]